MEGSRREVTWSGSDEAPAQGAWVSALGQRGAWLGTPLQRRPTVCLPIFSSAPLWAWRPSARPHPGHAGCRVAGASQGPLAARTWKTKPRSRSCTPRDVISWSSKNTRPEVGSSSPAIRRSSVVLPAGGGGRRGWARAWVHARGPLRRWRQQSSRGSSGEGRGRLAWLAPVPSACSSAAAQPCLYHWRCNAEMSSLER